MYQIIRIGKQGGHAFLHELGTILAETIKDVDPRRFPLSERSSGAPMGGKKIIKALTKADLVKNSSTRAIPSVRTATFKPFSPRTARRRLIEDFNQTFDKPLFK